ncbi:MAG: hypothetical protein IJR85_04665 [Synergistaceae bacterium]|nr:hypothetical protein [Synergistaceae bacterium]
MDEVYVRKDMFNEIMKRMETKMEASEARTQSQLSQMRVEIAEIRGDVKALSRQAEGLADTIVAYVSGFSSRGTFWQFLLGGIIGLSAIIVAGVQVYLAVKAS